MKKVAIIMDTWFPVNTGEQVYVARIAEALARERNYKVDIFTRAIAGKLTAEQRATEETPNIKIKRFGMKSHPWNIFMQVWFVVATFFHLLLAGKGYSVYHSHSATSAVPMKMASWFTNVPTVLTVHGNNVFDRAWTLRKIIHRIMFLETVYSQEISTSEYFLRAQNLNDPVLVIPYGVDSQEFEKVKEQRVEGQFNVLFVGRLDYMKGLDVLLKAAKKVIESNGFIQSHKDFLLHLVGAGPDRGALMRLAEKLEIQNFVKFHGLVTGENLIDLYKRCDLFVLPSRTEALPFAVLEAASARLPILATNVGDLKKLVIENVNGHLVEPDDVDELAYYLEQFAGNPHLSRMGDASYDLVTQEYTWENTVKKLVRVYENVTEKAEKKQVETSRKELITPWEMPLLLWKNKAARKPYRGENSLQFCFAVNLEPPEGASSDSEGGETFDAFLEKISEFCSGLEMPATFFIKQELAPAYEEELTALTDGGHEINFGRAIASEDPDVQIVWKFGVPFGRIIRMNLTTVLEMTDEALLKSVNRLRSYQRQKGLRPFLIFECSSKDFENGETFTELSKKLAVLRTEMNASFLTLRSLEEQCRL
jgi:glycosyltransferase involved in cell wall biosynthesis